MAIEAEEVVAEGAAAIMGAAVEVGVVGRAGGVLLPRRTRREGEKFTSFLALSGGVFMFSS